MLADVQQNKEGFVKLPIQKVGIRGIKIPMKLKKKEGGFVDTIATISSYCNLVPDVKGINMSRISRTINDVLKDSDSPIESLDEFVYALRDAHKATDIYIKASFEFLYKTKSPIEKLESIEPVQVVFESTLNDTSPNINSYITVKSTEMSLCPCSKEMSLLRNNLTEAESRELFYFKFSDSLQNKLQNAGFGAHNQKSIVEVKVQSIYGVGFIWIEDLVSLIRDSVSSPTWSTLKRPDEKWVTETSYMGGYFNENKQFIKTKGGPMFVEDIARNVAAKLNEMLDHEIEDYTVIVNNQESIHSDDIMATAIITAGRNLA